MNRSPFSLALLAAIDLSVTGALQAISAAARGRVSIGIQVAPPPPRFEQVSAASIDYL
jgi:hypothetical protein